MYHIQCLITKTLENEKICGFLFVFDNNSATEWDNIMKMHTFLELAVNVCNMRFFYTCVDCIW